MPRPTVVYLSVEGVSGKPVCRESLSRVLVLGLGTPVVPCVAVVADGQVLDAPVGSVCKSEGSPFLG